MDARASSVPRTLGILSIACASIVSFGSARAFVLAPRALVGVASALLIALSGWLLALGVGQLRYRARARRGSRVWAKIALGVVASMLIVALVAPPLADALLLLSGAMLGFHAMLLSSALSRPTVAAWMTYEARRRAR